MAGLRPQSKRAAGTVRRPNGPCSVHWMIDDLAAVDPATDRTRSQPVHLLLDS